MNQRASKQEEIARAQRRRGGLATVAAGLLIVGVVAAARAEDSFGDSARRLGHAELTRLLAEGARFRALPLGREPGPFVREYFHAGGSYEACADRVEVLGAFVVRHNAICITTRDATACREVRRTLGGDYFERYAQARGWQRVEISKSAAETCRTAGVMP